MGQSVSFQDDAGLDEDVLIPGAYKTSFIGAPASSAPVDSEAPPFVPIDPTIYLPGKPQEPTPDSGRDNASLTEATCSAELDESTARIDTINIHGGTFNDVGGDYIYTINNFFNPLYADDPWSSAPGPKPPDVQAMKVGKIVEWLSPIINFRATQVEVRERRTPGTGAWLLQGELYNEWKSGVLRVIWGVGMAGAGKTVLASSIIDDLLQIERTSSGCVSVVFAYCRCTDALSVKEILAAFLKQYLEHHPELVKLVEPMYLHHRRDKTYPSQDELITLLRGIETMFVVSFYVVEGLDEALNNTQFDLISALSLLKGKFVITSRPLAHSESDIPSAKFFTIVARAEDIRLALNQKLVLNPRFRRLIEQHRCKEEITSKIIQKSNGMFLHAALQIEALQQCLTITSLRASLEQFPNKMTDMYRTTLQRVENQSPEHSALAKRVLLWVNYAQCPLSVRDIQCALAICPQTDTFKKDLVVDEATLIAVCYGLIGVEKTGTVHLIHSTARDFVSQFLRGIYRNPHEVLARTSIQRLVACKLIESDEAFEEWDLEDAFAQYPLLQYSYNYWAFHAKKCQSDPEFDALLRFFMSKCAAFPCNLAQDDWEWNEGTLDLLKPLHLAARHGFHQFIPEFLLLEGQSQEHSWSALNSRTRGKFGATALMLASHYNHTTAVKVLVRVRGINVNAVNGSGRTALHLAARKGHELAVRCLLQARDIDPNAVDEEGYTPLMLAAEKGHVGVVRVLARVPGVQPNVATVQHRQTALMLAAEGGFEDAVRILLRVGGTDVNMRDWDGRTALMVASNEGHGHGAVGCILQDPDVQVNLKDWNHRTALMLASKEGHADTVGQLLRVPGLDVNSTRRGMTALMMAASEGHQDVVRGLLRFEGVDANAVTDEGGWTALMLAARGGHESVVRLLVTCGSARVDIASKSGRTALDLASDNAHHGIVRLLTQVRI